MQPLRTYFITGATGAVGSALVPFLMADPDVHVKLLIRAKSQDELSLRLERLFQFWEWGAENIAFRSRVTGLRGDVTHARFGLTESEYQRLVDSCTHIVHAAGNVRINLPLDAARCSAVDSAQHIIALACACHERGSLQKVEFLSTVGVGGRLQYVPEDWLEEPRDFHNTYEQAKAEAESYLREKVGRFGLPVTVHRPSMVVGDARNGKIIHFQIFYYLCEFLSGKQTHGILPDFRNVRLDTIPADYVARALHWSSKNIDNSGNIFHLCSGPKDAMEIDWLVTALRKILSAHGEQLPPLHRVPQWVFKSTLPVLKRLNSAKNYRKSLDNLSLFMDYASHPQAFINDKTDHILSSNGITVPAPEDYLNNLINAYLEQTGN